MSLKYNLLCNNCHYEAIVSGGEEIGEDILTRTYQCLNCKILFDWHTCLCRSFTAKNASRKDTASRRQVSLLESFFDLPDILFCPQCRTSKIVEWNYETGACPGCRQRMEIIGILKFF